MHSSSPVRTSKLQLATGQPSTAKCWIPPKKEFPHPRAKEKTQQDGRRGEVTFRVKLRPSECRAPKNSRRDKKAFLSDQCKEIEEKNRMGKTRDLLKKIRDTKGTFHAKMDSIKDRNGMGLTEAEDIKKWWQAYTEELYKKDLHDPDNHNGVITQLEPDILESEIKWALGSITRSKTSG